ncbi:putative membrane protein YdjX (TVP38/TMEM64 family) [Paenibacillus castaneae]|uniref:TVP38/TMEM64 family protein n=1 Tax=Paenibacillus castaneae TaxID=474957 RepID=UPI000C9A4495|nr:VTT domain-containing protein [Paenibacillus castaneae]NIK78238.1 putative membrane protein YdjX (TVP38/TMEM64 family) [Paenibacillus castaneae]
MKLKFLIVIYALAAIVFFVCRHALYDWMQNGHPSIWLMFLLAVCFIVFPIIPFKLVIGMMGFIYGPLLGALISWLAASLASVIVFVLVRKSFQKQGRAMLSRFPQVERLSVMLEKNPFFTLVLARMMPIFPQAVINVYPALLSVPLVTYAVASAIGKVPAMLVFSFLGNRLFTDWSSTLLVMGIYVCFLIIVYAIYRLWLRKQLI